MPQYSFSNFSIFEHSRVGTLPRIPGPLWPPEWGLRENWMFFRSLLVSCAAQGREMVLCGRWGGKGFSVVSGTMLSVLAPTTNSTSLSSECCLTSSLGTNQMGREGKRSSPVAPKQKMWQHSVKRQRRRHILICCNTRQMSKICYLKTL